ncbi:MAG TPA: membrane protein insertion efficiency factor YidD [Spirochaetota bacterium]|jgi:hypothetical protein|nr:membrane protein insertion efficiency factor YidD [Spirochaetota bacterium]OQA97411.1 MAG: putative membrane protein insertion efficiency factor [Spirochaetes bacterium ADurb.Bin218]HOK02466.1 membrane protein insertion efficiency factor YidD [Spirochaetota bacterium]HOK92716.1 membrane protein insertion efficiency factor YidD [Spirochaetota bacterium]HON16189.1 membrane protein insertion efficiency factor YidD [Spirochaetota bacterium]
MKRAENLSWLKATGQISAIAMIRLYKYLISPLLPKACRYYPSCSAYSEEAIRRFGLIKGGYLAARRVLSCNPFGGYGYDPVPDKFSLKR